MSESTINPAPAKVAPAPTTGASKPAGPPAKVFAIDTRYVAPVLVSTILIIANLTQGVLESYTRTALAIITAVLMEAILGKIFTGKIPHLASSYVSGISVGILVRSPEYWPYIWCAMLATSSKYVFRYQGHHIFNPSNLAITTALFLAPAYVASLGIQWGNAVPPMIVIWIFGAVIISRLKRFHITLTYVVSFVVFSFVRSLFTHSPFLAEVAPITGPMYQLYIFFMITDPKTTVSTKKGQMLVAFLVAFVEMILRLRGDVHAPYNALFLVGPIAFVIDLKLKALKKASLAAATA